MILATKGGWRQREAPAGAGQWEEESALQQLTKARGRGEQVIPAPLSSVAPSSALAITLTLAATLTPAPWLPGGSWPRQAPHRHTLGGQVRVLAAGTEVTTAH